jgi:hypothetical protein
LGGVKDFIKKIMILNWMWLKKLFRGRNVYVTLKRQEENIKASCPFIIVMENG